MKKRTRRAKYENYYNELKKLGVLTEVNESEDNNVEKEKRIEDMTKKELIEVLKRKGIEATEQLNKDNLIELYKNNIEGSNEIKTDDKEIINENVKEDKTEVNESVEGTVEILDINEEE